MDNADNFIKFLKTELERRRIGDPSYSLRAFAADLGMEGATLSQLLSRKRKLTFEAARGILKYLNPPLDVRNALILSLDNPGQYPAVKEPLRVLTETELKALSAWEAYAILSALDLQTIESTASGIAAAIGSSVATVEGILDHFLDLGFVRQDGDRFYQTGVILTTTNQTPSAALIQAHFAWINKALDVLGAIGSGTETKLRDFSGVTTAASRAKFPEAARRILDFRRSLAAFLADGHVDTVVRLNIQMFDIGKN